MKAVFDSLGVTVTLSPRNVKDLYHALQRIERDPTMTFSLRKLQEEDSRFVTVQVGDGEW